MAKKSVLSEAADAVKSVAGAALGAAAAAATTVVVTRVAGALAQGGNRLGQAAPALEQGAARAVVGADPAEAAKAGGRETQGHHGEEEGDREESG